MISFELDEMQEHNDAFVLSRREPSIATLLKLATHLLHLKAAAAAAEQLAGG
jgi:hypothetical protein